MEVPEEVKDIFNCCHRRLGLRIGPTCRNSQILRAPAYAAALSGLSSPWRAAGTCFRRRQKGCIQGGLNLYSDGRIWGRFLACLCWASYSRGLAGPQPSGAAAAEIKKMSRRRETGKSMTGRRREAGGSD